MGFGIIIMQRAGEMLSLKVVVLFHPSEEKLPWTRSKTERLAGSAVFCQCGSWDTEQVTSALDWL